MKHDVTLTSQKKIKRWLELCNFSYALMENNLSPAQLQRRFTRMRKEQVKKNETILRKLADLQS